MKKILLMASLVFLGFASKAQAPFKQSTTNSAGVVVDAGADTMTYTVTTPYLVVGIQPLAVKNSGTAAGTMTLSASINGTDWFAVTGITALTLTNAARNSVIWTIPNSVYRYFRIITTGGTTMNVSTSAIIWATK